MVPIKMLSKGMRVKIVDEWVDGCNQNDEGRMDKYLGQVVTVLEIMDRTSVLIEEDAGDCPSHIGGHWYWNRFCFDYIVEEQSEDIEPASDEELLSFLFGEGA